MAKFKPGDRVVITKPEDTNEAPYWAEPEMDAFVGIATVKAAMRDKFRIYEDDGEWEYGNQWAELAEPKNTETPTLRDQFAMAALTGLLASGAKGGGTKDPHEIVSIAAYAVADAMLTDEPPLLVGDRVRFASNELSTTGVIVAFDPNPVIRFEPPVGGQYYDSVVASALVRT